MERGDYIGVGDFHILPLDLKQKFIHALTFMGIEVSGLVRRLASRTSNVNVYTPMVLYMHPQSGRVTMGFKHMLYATGKQITIDDINRIIELTGVGYQNE